ncbi:MAG TPA: LysR substrate-binding domain-containing protein, partial [Acidimicrobiales bacterium]|nr:LysR substrate-binding domain-containing protein [Acidimicrobiales bacterium]
VSRQIATLEAEVGTTLVRRVPQGAVLTDAGRLLVEHGTAVLARLSEAEAELRALLGLQGGRVRLASFASAASSIVPRAIVAFRDLYPAVELSVAMADPVDSMPRLRAGELDLALSHDPTWFAAGQEGLEFVHLFDDPMYAALPVAHALADVASLSLSDLADEPWMLGTTASCPDSRLFRSACLEAGFEPRIALQNDDYSAILGFVASGFGVALIPEMVTRVIRDDIVIRRLEPPPPPRPILVAVPGGYRPPAVAAMIDVLRAVSDTWVADRAPLAEDLVSHAAR